VVKIIIIVKHLLYVELDLVKVCQTVGGQKSTIIYIVIKADFWPPCQCSELLQVTSSAYLITALHCRSWLSVSTTCHSSTASEKLLYEVMADPTVVTIAKEENVVVI
jgi:hypothetical protein